MHRCLSDHLETKRCKVAWQSGERDLAVLTNACNGQRHQQDCTDAEAVPGQLPRPPWLPGRSSDNRRNTAGSIGFIATGEGSLKRPLERRRRKYFRTRLDIGMRDCHGCWFMRRELAQQLSKLWSKRKQDHPDPRGEDSRVSTSSQSHVQGTLPESQLHFHLQVHRGALP